MNANVSSLFSHSLNLEKFVSKKILASLIHPRSRFRIFDPKTTLKLFIFQVLSSSSCKGALASFNFYLYKNGLPAVSMNTASYCTAKQRLNIEALTSIVTLIGRKIQKQCAGLENFWKLRKTFFIDGTILNLEDTEDIKKTYPHTYAKGLTQGQPKMRLLGVFCAISGAFLDGAISSYGGEGASELALLNILLPRIARYSLLIMDRFFAGVELQFTLQKKKIDYVVRSRDSFAIRRIGKESDLILNLVLNKKTQPSKILRVRIIKSSIKRKGFRTATMYLMTSLCDQTKYPAAEIAQMYLRRWNVELDIRNLKCTLGGRLLKSRTAEMAEKELWVILMSYNLVRLITAIAAKKNDHLPRKISFKASMSCLRESLNYSTDIAIDWITEILSKEILNSKYRREARALKKRNRRYPLLTTSREQAKNENWGYSRRRIGRFSTRKWGKNA